MDHPTPSHGSPTEHRRSRRRRCTVTGGLQARRLPTLIAPGVEAEALLRSTLDALSAHIAVLDEAGTISPGNPALPAFSHGSCNADEDHRDWKDLLADCERAASLSNVVARTV